MTVAAAPPPRIGSAILLSEDGTCPADGGVLRPLEPDAHDMDDLAICLTCRREYHLEGHAWVYLPPRVTIAPDGEGDVRF